MATYTIADSFFLNGVGFNGATVTAWKASRFSGVPAENSAPPSGTADAGPVTTGPTYGGEGAFQIAAPTNEDYYVSVVVSTNRYWKLYNAASWQDGATPSKLVTNLNTLDDGSGNASIAGTLAVTGAATLSSTAQATAVGVNTAPGATGSLKTNHNVLDDGSGNATVAGTFGVTGALTASSTVQATAVGVNTAPGAAGSLKTNNSTLDDGSGNLQSGGTLKAGASGFTATNVGVVTATGTITGTALIPSGLTGSVAATRFVGGTTIGPPTTGAHLVGDFVVDQTAQIWICTAAGTPGTWKTNAPPACRAYRNAAYNSVQSATTTVPYDSTNYDNYSGFSASTHLYTVPVAGLYFVTGGIALTLGDGNYLNTYILKNGTQITQQFGTDSGGSGATSNFPVTDVVQLAANDTIGIAYNTNASAAAATVGGFATYMCIYKVSS